MTAAYKERLERLDLIVALLPEAGSSHRGLSAKALLIRLESHFADHKNEWARLRAIQRDLQELCRSGRVRAIGEKATSFYYLRIPESDGVDLYAWNYALLQLEAQMAGVVSSRQLDLMLTRLQEPNAGSVLGNDKLRIIPDSLRLKPAAIAPTVLTEVLRALAQDQVLEASYLDSEGKATTPKLHPQGLLQRGPRVYLFALKEDEDFIRTYALHRMRKAVATSVAARKLEGFDLDAVVYSGLADFADENSIMLRALIRGYIADLLYECPINDSQRLEAVADDPEFPVKLCVELPNSGQLLRWLLGCGEHLKVLEPANVRGAVASQARKMAELYRTGDDGYCRS